MAKSTIRTSWNVWSCKILLRIDRIVEQGDYPLSTFTKLPRNLTFVYYGIRGYQVVRNMKKFCFFFNCSYVIVPVLIIEPFAWIIAQIIACSARKISWNFRKSASRASRRCGFLTSFSKLNMLFSRIKSDFLFCLLVNSFKSHSPVDIWRIRRIKYVTQCKG